MTIEESRKNLAKEVWRSVREGGGWVLEADGNLNDASRSVVEAYRSAGGCFLGRINSFGSAKAGVWCDDGGMVYNFGADFVLPPGPGVEEVRQAIRDREEAPYTGIRDDSIHIRRIQAAIAAAGGAELIWS